MLLIIAEKPSLGRNIAAAIGPMAKRDGYLEGSDTPVSYTHLKQFDSVTQIADHLLNKRTIVLNLEDTNKETARRLIDFLSGIAYSIDGQLKRVANNTFVITPNNVDVSGEQLRSNEPKKEESADLYRCV